MTEEAPRARLHDVHASGTQAERDGVLAAVERAVASGLGGDASARDPEVLRQALAQAISREVTTRTGQDYVDLSDSERLRRPRLS